MAELGLSDAYKKWADDLTRYATALVGPADANDVVAEVFVTSDVSITNLPIVEATGLLTRRATPLPG